MDPPSPLRPPWTTPVRFPTALRWVPGRFLPSSPQELTVGTRDGELFRLDPATSTCTLVAADPGEIAALDVHPDGTRYATASRDGRLVTGALAGGPVHAASHPFLDRMQLLLAEEHLLVVGELFDSRAVFVFAFATGEVRARIRVPAGVMVSLAADGRPYLCRSTAAGLDILPFAPGWRFPSRDVSSAHRLCVSGGFVLGFERGTVCLWDREGGVPRTLRLPEVVAGDVSADGRWLALGTERGAVTLFRVAQLSMRIRPALVRAFRDPVTTVALSPRGRWLATGAESLKIWPWEEEGAGA